MNAYNWTENKAASNWSMHSKHTLAVASRQRPSTCWNPVYASIAPWRNRARSGARQTPGVHVPA